MTSSQRFPTLLLQDTTACFAIKSCAALIGDDTVLVATCHRLDNGSTAEDRWQINVRLCCIRRARHSLTVGRYDGT